MCVCVSCLGFVATSGKQLVFPVSGKHLTKLSEWLQ